MVSTITSPSLLHISFILPNSKTLIPSISSFTRLNLELSLLTNSEIAAPRWGGSIAGFHVILNGMVVRNEGNSVNVTKRYFSGTLKERVGEDGRCEFHAEDGSCSSGV
ncbi:hypothetical protein Droror1_Dr00024804 [Drosera rotundifolia]